MTPTNKPVEIEKCAACGRDRCWITNQDRYVCLNCNSKRRNQMKGIFGYALRNKRTGYVSVGKVQVSHPIGECNDGWGWVEVEVRVIRRVKWDEKSK